MVELFGWEFKKSQAAKKNENETALPEPKSNDGSLDISNDYGFGGAYGFGNNLLDYEAPQDEIKLVTKYRDLSGQSEIMRAIDDIINEAFSYDEDTYPVKLNITDEALSEATKKKIYDEFEYILGLLNFDSDAYEVFRRWYVDGRIYYQKIIDPNQPSKGIKQLRYIDPRKIRKIRKRKGKPQNQQTQVQGVEVGVEYEEYYVYNPKGINQANPTGLKISLDAITFVHSGLFTKDNKTILSYIHQAIRFYNSLRNLEDAVVIYRLTRAPERRVFNVEAGQLPPNTAKEYLQNLMNKFRKKLSFDPITGEVLEQKRFLSMQEDFWFLKRDGKGTTVDILSGGQTLGELTDVEYFKKKLYESLNVPISRMDASQGFSIGRPSEITRDELKFSKFVSRLRKRFSHLFDDMLRTQLILKKIVTPEDWNRISKTLHYDFIEDNKFTELKDTEIYANRFNTLAIVAPQLGVFVSKKWAKVNVLRMTDEEIDEMQKEMDEEAKDDKKKGRNADGTPIPPPPPAPVIAAPQPQQALPPPTAGDSNTSDSQNNQPPFDAKI